MKRLISQCKEQVRIINFYSFNLLIEILKANKSTPFSNNNNTLINNNQPQYITTPSNNNKFYTISKAQLKSLSHRIPSFGSLAVIFLVCYGIGAAITHLIKYTIKYWWPKSNPVEERLQQIEQKIETASKMVENQVNEMKDIVKTLKSFLESQIDSVNSNVRYDSLKKRLESSDESELKKELTLVRFLLSTVATINRVKFMSSANNLELFDEVKQEIDNVKSSIKKAFRGSVIPPVKSRSRLISSDHLEKRKMELPSWMKEQEPKIPDWQKDEPEKKNENNNVQNDKSNNSSVEKSTSSEVTE